MNQLDQITQLIDEAMYLSDAFVKLHGFSSNNDVISIKEDDYKIILPYLFFNPKQFPSISRSPHILFRLSYMQELFETSIEAGQNSFQNLPLLFEECQHPSQKIQFLQRDLAIIEQNDKGIQPLFLNLLQYSQYISDCLPILYAKFSSFFKLSTFISVAFSIGEIAVKSFCFCFPNIIFPVFQTALAKSSTDSLIISIATLSPNHRPLLHPKLIKFPLIFSLLAIKFFKEESPLIILSSIQGCYPEIKNELIALSKNDNLTPSFYKLYARCCSSLCSIEKVDYEILKKCKDEKLIIATLFNIGSDQTKIFNDFIQMFTSSSNPTTMPFLYDLIYDLKEEKNDYKVSNKIKNILGDDYDWQIKRSFYNHFFTSFKTIELKSKFIGTDLNGLKIFSWLINDLDTNCSINWLPEIISTLTKFDVNGASYIYSIVNSIKNKKVEDFRMVIENFVRKVKNNVFDLNEIAKNPAPAIASTIFILESEKQIRSVTKIFDFSIINFLPLRFVVCCASQSENCSSVFEILDKLCNNCAGHVFYQIPYMTLKPDFLLSKGDPQLFLRTLSEIIFKNEINLINESTYSDWMIHRFISPFQYSVDTVYALGGPINIEQLHQVFDFSKEILHNKYLLQIIFICMIDYIALFEKVYPHSDKEKNFNDSVVLILYSALNLLKDQLIYKNAVYDFLNDLIFISPWIVKPFIIQGCDTELIYSITHGVSALDTFWNTIKDITKSVCNKQNVLVFILQFVSHLIDMNRSWRANMSCKEILKVMVNHLKVNDENVSIVVDSILRIFKVFPDLYSYIDQLLKAINEQVKSQSSSANSFAILNLAFDEVSSYSISQKV